MNTYCVSPTTLEQSDEIGFIGTTDGRNVLRFSNGGRDVVFGQFFARIERTHSRPIRSTAHQGCGSRTPRARSSDARVKGNIPNRRGSCRDDHDPEIRSLLDNPRTGWDDKPGWDIWRGLNNLTIERLDLTGQFTQVFLHRQPEAHQRQPYIFVMHGGQLADVLASCNDPLVAKDGFANQRR